MNATSLATILTFVSALILPMYSSSDANAQSQDECAIWLCLPAGFPAGCAAPHKAFLNRLRKGKSPLPAWGSCAAQHPDAPPVDAQAQFGADPYLPCREGYHLVAASRHGDGGSDEAQCVSNETRSSPFGGDVPIDSYAATPRPNGGRFVTYTVNGQLVYPTDQAGTATDDPRFFY